eukprot:SAG31_NODE_7575_length_1650_cov_1.535139_1_plen_55_part_10
MTLSLRSTFLHLWAFFILDWAVDMEEMVSVQAISYALHTLNVEYDTVFAITTTGR